MVRYSYNQITQAYTSKKKNMSTLWARCFSRPLSFPITYVLINLGISANIVSIMSILVVIMACVLLSFKGFYSTLSGVIMILMWHVLDCVDGNIARVKNESSYIGEFVDAVSGYTASTFVFIATGMAAYHTTELFAEYKYMFIFMGAIASSSETLARLIHNRYSVAVYRLAYQNKMELPDIKNDDPEGQRGVSFLASRIRKVFGFSSMFMPLLIISMLSNHFDYLIIFYTLYTTSWLILVCIVYIKRAIEISNK